MSQGPASSAVASDHEGASAAGLGLIDVQQMYAADRLAIAGGVPGVALMAEAGRALAEAIVAREKQGPVLVLCGPGNNGGDGFVAARLLAEAGWPVQLALLGDVAGLKGDAAHHAKLWPNEVHPLDPALIEEGQVVVDALFGAGLSRPLEGVARDCVIRLNDMAGRCKSFACYAVDMPSGVSGDSGQVLGDFAVRAKVTVTFFRKKPGHLLYPGAGRCGEVVLADIGIPAAVLDEIRPTTWCNAPGLWLPRYPWRGPESHKYRFGHAVVVAGPGMTGAAKLAALAALRVGAGLVTVACDNKTLPLLAPALTSVICQAVENQTELAALLADSRLNAVLIGPGAGVSAETRESVLAILATGKAVVLDADALTVFAEDPAVLFDGIAARTTAQPTVLTPHDGEFARLFPDLTGDRLSRARAAAARSGAVVVSKGADSVIARPDGTASINCNAPPSLATAGAGDVLAGLVVGLLAQGLSAYDTAAAAVWLHGAAAAGFGPGLIAEDLPQRLPQVLAQIAPADLF